MKLSKNKLALAIVGATAVGIAGLGTAGIKGSKHDLGVSSTTQGNNIGSVDGEVCVFCHTPHGSATGVAVPLWNKELPTTTYVTYDQLGTSSLDGAVASVGSVSLACLSCHDGTQAMDNMLNMPGTGMKTQTGLAVNQMDAISGLVIPNLGSDLKNDHPVGIQYCGGGYTTTSSGTASSICTDKDFEDATMVDLNGTPIWYVDVSVTGGNTSGSVGSRDKYDMQLYTRESTGTGYAGTGFANENEPFVECASCHDPHAADNNTFLRINNTNSNVCLACHAK